MLTQQKNSTGAPAPEIATERMLLRGHRLEDFEDCAALWADPDVTRYIGGRPFSREEVWTRLLRYVGHWWLMGFGFWVVTEKSSGRFIGEVGFADFKRDIQPSLEGYPEMGWVLAKSAHGRGLGTEAVRAAVAWADTHLGSKRTVCMILPENTASLRVASKCGYREFGSTNYKNTPVTLFERINLQSSQPSPQR
jgi:RimJ/RimL family protein N-acetyltransferase